VCWLLCIRSLIRRSDHNGFCAVNSSPNHCNHNPHCGHLHGLCGDFFLPSHLLSFSLLAGILLTAVGSVMTAFFALIEGMSYSLLAGVIPLAIGVCFLIFFGIKKRMDRNE